MQSSDISYRVAFTLLLPFLRMRPMLWRFLTRDFDGEAKITLWRFLILMPVLNVP